MDRKFLAVFAVVFGVASCDRGITHQPPESESASESNQPSAQSTSSYGDAKRVRFEGFSFELPGGWRRVVPDREKTKAMLLLGSAQWNTARGMVMVDSGKPAHPDANAMATALATSWGGTIQSEPTVVDGEKAYSVQASPQNTGLLPKSGIVAFRHERVFLIMAGSVEGIDVAGPLEHIRATWNWED